MRPCRKRIHQTDGDGASGEAEYPGQHRTQLDTAPEGKRRAGYGDGERERSLLKKTKVTKKTRAHAYIRYVRVCEKKGPASAASASAFTAFTHNALLFKAHLKGQYDEGERYSTLQA